MASNHSNLQFSEEKMGFKGNMNNAHDYRLHLVKQAQIKHQ